MANPATRIGVLRGLLFAGLAVIVGRAFQLQVLQGPRWAEIAARTRTETRRLPARRGTVYDRQERPLAVSQEFYRVGVAPWEVPAGQVDSLRRLLIRRLGLPADRVGEAFRTRRRGEHYLYRYRPASASQVAELRGFRGVKLERLFLRAYASGPLARDLIGALISDSGRGRSGLERSLDSLLAGVPGEAGFLRDGRGRLYESPDRLVRDPVAGHDVVLTLDAELQGIAESALGEALEEAQADGGDVVLVEPRSGEVLALASQVRRAAGAKRVGAWVPAEPGSTIKPFAAAGLLALGRARASDSVYAERGEWHLSGRSRPIRDTHPLEGWVTLAQAIQVSSNIGATKFSLALRPEEHYEILRDFGFGTPTGVETPYESSGRLKRPDGWIPSYTQPSMAQGYELEVTPLQLAAAYAALANDGLLPGLTLVKEIWDPGGRVVYRHAGTPVRRVVRPEVAAEVRGFLRQAASDSGTGGRAQLATYQVLGKTGTARNVVGRSYAGDSYTASFAGLFPADDPQLVVVVRMVNPRGAEYYGGQVAAPLTRRILQEALATRRSGLDRARLLAGADPAPASFPGRRNPLDAPARVVVALPVRRGAPDSARRAPIPDVLGLGARAAAARLHRAGFRVSLEGWGQVRAVEPLPGDSARIGSRVRLRADGNGAAPR